MPKTYHDIVAEATGFNTPEDFKTMLQSAGAPAAFTSDETIQMVWDIADTNGDDIISAEEEKAFLQNPDIKSTIQTQLALKQHQINNRNNPQVAGLVTKQTEPSAQELVLAGERPIDAESTSTNNELETQHFWICISSFSCYVV